LSFKTPTPSKSYSVSRVNQLIATIYSFLLVAVVSEALVNGFAQIDYLEPVVFATSVGLLTVLILGFLISHLASRSPIFWFRSIPVLTLALLFTWPLHFDSSIVLPESFKPWIWWLLGISAVAAGISFRFWLGVVYIFVVSFGWFALRVSPSGGSGEIVLAIQDSVHLFILASIGTVMAAAVRWQAAKTDFAHQNLILSGVKSAQSQAVSLEQSRLDALVHDSVLTSLLVAAKAQTPQEISLARESAAEAIRKLDADNESVKLPTTFTQVSFFEALSNRIHEVYPNFEVSLEQTNDSQLPASVSEALTEATLQAVDNSSKHAGSASKRYVSLQSHGTGLKIVVSDNGKGFRPSKISRDRLGIQLSIIGRVKAVGGRVFIRSEPGKGTDVVLEWSPSV
jgi:two-component sensor histidine kinase